MAAIDVSGKGYTQEKGIDYTWTVAALGEESGIPNDRYFYNFGDNLPYYKDAGGVTIAVFAGGGGDNIYTSDGSLTSLRTISLGAFGLGIGVTGSTNFALSVGGATSLAGKVTMDQGTSTINTVSGNGVGKNVGFKLQNDGTIGSTQIDFAGELKIRSNQGGQTVLNSFYSLNPSITTHSSRSLLIGIAQNLYLMKDNGVGTSPTVRMFMSSGGLFGFGGSTTTAGKTVTITGDSKISGDCNAATYSVGASAGVSGTFATSVTVVNGIVTAGVA